MNKILVFRYCTNPEPNREASLALKPHYNVGSAGVIPTPFGMLSILLSESTPEAVFMSLTRANIGNHFTVTQIDENDVPIKILTSTHISDRLVGLSQEDLDATKTQAEINAEFDAFLTRVHRDGRESLTEEELARMSHLSEIVTI